MDKFASDAGAFFSRTTQKIEETFKTAEKTPLNQDLIDLHEKAVVRRDWAKTLTSFTQNVVQPNPAMRIQDAVLKGIDRKVERATAGEQFGDYLNEVGQKLGSSSSCADMFGKVGTVESQIGRAEHEMLQKIEQQYLKWLQDYVNVDAADAMSSWTALENCRLALDSKKTAHSRAKDDLAKSKITPQLSEAQSQFDSQTTVTSTKLQQFVKKFDEQQPVLRQLLQAQADYFKACNEMITKALA